MSGLANSYLVCDGRWPFADGAVQPHCRTEREVPVHAAQRAMRGRQKRAFDCVAVWRDTAAFSHQPGPTDALPQIEWKFIWMQQEANVGERVAVLDCPAAVRPLVDAGAVDIRGVNVACGIAPALDVTEQYRAYVF